MFSKKYLLLFPVSLCLKWLKKTVYKYVIQIATQVRSKMKINWNKVACIKISLCRNTMHLILCHKFFLENSRYSQLKSKLYLFRSSRPEVFLRKGVLKICSKFTGEHPYRSVISIKLQSNWNQTSAWVFSCKLTAFFQNTFS